MKKLIKAFNPLRRLSGSARMRSFSEPLTWCLLPWWSRKPLVGAHAVLFASRVDDSDKALSREQLFYLRRG